MPEPVLVGLLFADRVTEEINHKKTIVGTFSFFHAPRFPATFAPWFVYAAVTNLDPEKHTFSILLSDDDSQHVLFSMGGELVVEEPSAVAEFFQMLPNVTFPKAGKYNLLFHIDGRQIGSRVLQVKLLEKSGG